MEAVEFAINVIVEGELLFMALNSGRVNENLRRVWVFLRRTHIYPADSTTAGIYGEIKSELFAHFGPRERAARRRTSIHQLGFDDNDLWIAATALQHNLTVVSADTDFHRIAEVRPLPLESWRP